MLGGFTYAENEMWRLFLAQRWEKEKLGRVGWMKKADT